MGLSQQGRARLLQAWQTHGVSAPAPSVRAGASERLYRSIQQPAPAGVLECLVVPVNEQCAPAHQCVEG